MKKCFILAMLLLGISSCGWQNDLREKNIWREQKPALRQIDHLNSEIKMEVIDEIPSMKITIIRFIDAGHTRYLAVKGDQVSISTQTSSGGKNPKHDDSSIQTVN